VEQQGFASSIGVLDE
jgi:hypothetical protein